MCRLLFYLLIFNSLLNFGQNLISESKNLKVTVDKGDTRLVTKSSTISNKG